MSKIEVDQIDPSSGTNLTVGSSGDTVTVTGNVVKSNALQGSDGGNIISQSGTTNTIGATGDVIKTAVGTTKLEVQGDGSSVEGKIQLNCHVNSHGVILQSPPHSAGQSYTIKLPDNQIAADKFIKIKSITGSGSTAVGQAEFADAGGGKVNQVIQTVKTDTFSSSSGSFTDITGMSATITPSASDSKVLVMVNINVASTYRDRWVALQLLRGSTNIYLGDAASSRTRASSFYVFFDATGKDTNIYERTMIFLDSPSTTSSTTYKLQGKTQTSNSPSFVVNRSGGDTDADYGGRTASSITLMEIKA